MLKHRAFTQNTKHINWVLRELSKKVHQGDSATLPSPESHEGTSYGLIQNDSLFSVMGTEDLHRAVSEAEVLALISKPPADIPTGAYLPHSEYLLVYGARP